MLHSISSLSTPLPVIFLGTQAQAKTEVKRLRNALLAREESTPGSLSQEFVLLEQPSREREDWGWTGHPWDQTDISSEQKEQVGVYVQSLLEAAYPAGESVEMEMTHRGFASYLQRDSPDGKLSGPLNAAELLGQIQDLHLIQLREEALEAGKKEGSLPFSDDEPEKIQESLGRFLASKEVELHLGERLGEGHFGVVVSARVKREEEKYVYKIEKRDVAKALTERVNSFWREGDCAATRCDNTHDLASPLFFIFRTCQEGKPEEFHYVPANYVKAFGMKLPPGTSVFLEGQLMKRATGESLEKIMLRNPSLLYPKGKHFSNIVRGLFSIIQDLQVRNLAHLDIKPENIFYDQQTGKVTLLDFGSAERLRKKGKVDDAAHLYQPTSTKIGGTPKYISPRVQQQKSHGSEVDLFSFAMTILELVHRQNFADFTHKRFPKAAQGDMRDVLFGNADATEYLGRFLDAVGERESQVKSSSFQNESFMSSIFSSSRSDNVQVSRSRARSESMDSSISQESSPVEKALARNPEVRMIVDLAFQASSGGTKGAAAYEKLKNLPYFQAAETPISPSLSSSPDISSLS